MKIEYEPRTKAGSALILAVVLTSLMAAVGVMFLMVARVDRMSTSAIAENKELNYAVETVVARISQVLALDVPGIAGEYYDYPGTADPWLASLEPYELAGDYYWRQISDINVQFGPQDVWSLPAVIIDDYQQPAGIGNGNTVNHYPADADGDGVSDSMWIRLGQITTSKGRPIFAAIRIVDNGGMLNVNTAYKFDPNETNPNLIDGSSQMQINLMALSWHPGDPCDSYNLNDETDLLNARANYGIGGIDPNDLDGYERNVVWRYNEPNGAYTPFDISDELEIRNRFLLNHPDIDTRLEPWGGEFRDDTLLTPVTSGGLELDKWFKRANDNGFLDPNYAYRHIATTYNMDRIINPLGEKMVNVNMDSVDSVYGTIRAGLYKADPNFVDANGIAAQIAVNLIDFRDGVAEPNVTTIDVDGTTYYGFERPCIYISELAHRFRKLTDVPPTYPIRYTIRKSYAIELYKPYLEDKYPDPNQWRIHIQDSSFSPIPVNWSGTEDFHVMLFEDPCAPLVVNFECGGEPNLDCLPQKLILDPSSDVFEPDKTITLQRLVGTNWIPVDSKTVPVPPIGGDWWAMDDTPRSIQRDITLHKCIRRLWSSAGAPYSPTLGSREIGDYETIDSNYIQAHPANTGFTNVGEIGMIFRNGAYYEVGQDPYLLGVIGYSSGADEEKEVRVDLADPNFQQLFKYLTVFDPGSDGINNDGDALEDGSPVIDEDDGSEWKVPGRININTAPWYVMAQLPWVSAHTPNYELAQAIVAYRDKTPGPDDDYSARVGAPGFGSIGELNRVVEPNYLCSIDYYAHDLVNLNSFPDLTPGDGGYNVPDDFEERDVIFSRISNLTTVRSDVFTAYILVRIGTDGPQKRVIAILDRSDVYPTGGRVRVRALHPVPDPR